MNNNTLMIGKKKKKRKIIFLKVLAPSSFQEDNVKH